MAVWPPSLPGLFAGVQRQRRPAFAQFQVDAGPAKRRKVFANASEDVVSRMVFTNEQMDIFNTFYEETLLEGTLEFDWADPVTMELASFRFNEPPQFAKTPTANGGVWQGSISIERLS